MGTYTGGRLHAYIIIHMPEWKVSNQHAYMISSQITGELHFGLLKIFEISDD